MRVAHATHSSDVRARGNDIESVGKWRLERSGKYPVNKIGEKISSAKRVIPGRCASIEPGISRFRVRAFARPGTTVWVGYAWLATAVPIAACAAARRAIGTR
jgi:hypothetical protein